ncbi:nucleotide-binding universal stress UspA family protein [Kitasatospora sp. GAS204A]|uniref:universal stress protein n=1 Tax=unclassified Kitasatospora TaxID=2633591 RepID=UPI002473B06E|nr:universal stress protein [Kitasatospora sp. GAS204B]MDH6121805.1 nucleotide-binding universal stress UspA family protein [Kitasatospora sp. GAS204B]
MTDPPVPHPAGPIVVGTDGSVPARQAVTFALREAQLRGTGLRAVCAYEYTPTLHSGFERAVDSGPDSNPIPQQRDLVTQAVADSVEQLRQQLGGPAVDVEIVCEKGRPAQVLLEASKGACLLVVGSRGSGAWGRLTLGSTSTEVVHHAHLPVVVIPVEHDTAAT